MANTAKVLTVDPQLEAISQISAKAILMAQDILALPYQPGAVSTQHPAFNQVNAEYGAWLNSHPADQARKRRAAVRVIMKRGRCTRYLATRAYDGLRAAGCL